MPTKITATMADGTTQDYVIPAPVVAEPTEATVQAAADTAIEAAFVVEPTTTTDAPAA